MKIKAVWQGKCPRCGKGDIFVHPISSVTQFTKMHKQCDQCNASFEPEPGFYYGSLFISYAFTVAIMVTVWVVLYFTVNPPDWVYGTALIFFTIVFIPFSFRYSRILFLYWFGGLARE